MRIINSAFNCIWIKNHFLLSYILAKDSYLVNPHPGSLVSLLHYYCRSYTVGQIKVGIGMHGSVIKVQKCLMSPRHKWDCISITFIPVGEAYPSRRSVSVCSLCAKSNKAVSCWAGNAGICAISGLPGKPLVNTTIVSVLVLLAAVHVCSLCLLLILHAAFKSYKMLSVQKLWQSRS
jgi:hypothetical protein